MERDMAFLVVGDYLRDARTLLQDRIEPYRYSTHSLVRSLNLTLLDARRMRPDLFMDDLDTVPQYQWQDDEDATPTEDKTNPTWDEFVPIEQGFRQAIIDGIVGHALSRDQEDIEDERATGFIQSMENRLLAKRATAGKQPPKV
jgi:hypothetical protein